MGKLSTISEFRESLSTVTSPASPLPISSRSKGSSTGSIRSKAVYPVSTASISVSSSSETNLPFDDRSRTARTASQVPNPTPIKVSLDGLARQDSVAALLDIVITPPQYRQTDKHWPEKYSDSTRSHSRSCSRRSRSCSVGCSRRSRSSRHEGWTWMERYPELEYRKRTV